MHLPRWRNWYTRTFEGRMRQLIRVQVPAWAPSPTTEPRFVAPGAGRVGADSESEWESRPACVIQRPGRPIEHVRRRSDPDSEFTQPLLTPPCACTILN